MKTVDKLLTVSILTLTSCGLFIPSVCAETAQTEVSATVAKVLDCSHSTSTVNVGSITPGGSASKQFSIGAKTNSSAGFSITASAFNNLSNSTTGSVLSYNPNAGAGQPGYKLVPTTFSEWKTSGSAIPSGSPLSVGAVWTHVGYEATENITATVGTDLNTAAGTYTGTINWTCSAL